MVYDKTTLLTFASLVSVLFENHAPNCFLHPDISHMPFGATHHSLDSAALFPRLEHSQIAFLRFQYVCEYRDRYSRAFEISTSLKLIFFFGLRISSQFFWHTLERASLSLKNLMIRYILPENLGVSTVCAFHSIKREFQSVFGHGFVKLEICWQRTSKIIST